VLEVYQSDYIDHVDLFAAFAIVSQWEEGTVTWNTRPAVDNLTLLFVSDVGSKTWINSTGPGLVELVQLWVDGGANFGLQIIAYGDSHYYDRIRSDKYLNGAYAPILHVQYKPAYAAGQTLSFTVHVRDSFGNPADGTAVTASLLGDGVVVPVDIVWAESPSSQLSSPPVSIGSASAVAAKAGVYTITLSVGGQMLSALNVSVAPGVTDAAGCTASGAGLSVAEASAVTTLQITARDAYGNVQESSSDSFLVEVADSNGNVVASTHSFPATFALGEYRGTYTVSVWLIRCVGLV
jgi:hypothetical protein